MTTRPRFRRTAHERTALRLRPGRAGLVVTLLAASLLTLANPGPAGADGPDESFGIRPSDGEPRPNESWFLHEAAAGQLVLDSAVVRNGGTEPVEVIIYPAESRTAENGGTAFASRADRKEGAAGTADWLKIDVDRLELAPGEEKAVRFAITVPADATPGEHVAGIVVESADKRLLPVGNSTATTIDGNASFQVELVRRSGVAVVIDVPGPRETALSLSSILLREQQDESGSWAVGVANDGATMVKGRGTLTVADEDGKEVAEVPFNLDTVLPGDETSMIVTAPLRLPDGDYVASAAAGYAPVRDGDEAGLASINNQRIRIRDGQPVLALDGKDENPAQSGDQASPAVPGADRGLPILLLALVGAGGALLLLTTGLVIGRRRARVARRSSRGRSRARGNDDEQAELAALRRELVLQAITPEPPRR